MANIVVVGAGVIGLTTALELSRRGHHVTVAAKHMPGDYDIEYASPWAGANYAPLMSITGERSNAWERDTWPVLEALARDHPEAGVHFQELRLYIRKKDAGTPKAQKFADAAKHHPWLKWRTIPDSELDPHIECGMECDSVCINTALYLPWLLSQCLKNGVVFQRATFKHIGDAGGDGVHHTGHSVALVVNCTGLSARNLDGVNDANMTPARGQITLVQNDAEKMYSITGTDDPEDENCYIMTRAAGGGTILGGCYQEGNWDSQPDPSLAVRIMTRTAELCPTLTNGKGIDALSVIRHGVGLRPLRHGGPRLESESIRGVKIVHCYGHAGFGYQSSYGCIKEVVQLVEQNLISTAQARL